MGTVHYIYPLMFFLQMYMMAQRRRHENSEELVFMPIVDSSQIPLQCQMFVTRIFCCERCFDFIMFYYQKFAKHNANIEL